MTATALSKWTADVTPGEQGYTLYARLNDAFLSDPIMAMFVPQMLTGLVAALVDRFTDAPTNDQSSRTVIADISPAMVYHEAQELIGTSPLSLLSGAAQQHLAETVSRGLFPHATAAARG